MRAFYGSRYPTQPELAAAKAREDGERTKIDTLRSLLKNHANHADYAGNTKVRDLAESIARDENRQQGGRPFRTAQEGYAAGYSVFLRERDHVGSQS